MHDEDRGHSLRAGRLDLYVPVDPRAGLVLVPIENFSSGNFSPCRQDRVCALDLHRNHRRARSGYRRTSQGADRL